MRHAHAIEMAHEGVPLVVIQRQLGHSNLGITSVYLQGIDSSEIVDTVVPSAGSGASGQRGAGHHLLTPNAVRRSCERGARNWDQRGCWDSVAPACSVVSTRQITRGCACS